MNEDPYVLHRQSHEKSDVDANPLAQHHTLGRNPNQAAPGNHNHDTRYTLLGHSHVTGAWINVTTMPEGASTWVNFGGVEPVAKYRIDDKWVELNGVIKSGVLGTTAFTLPVGFRPAFPKRFAVNSAGAYGMVYVTAAGLVQPFVGNVAAIDLDNIAFRAV